MQPTYAPATDRLQADLNPYVSQSGEDHYCKITGNRLFSITLSLHYGLALTFGEKHPVCVIEGRGRNSLNRCASSFLRAASIAG